MFKGKTWWVVGASEGLGRALAQDLDRRGAHVVVSARTIARLDTLADTLGSATVVAMDVTAPESVAEAVAQVGDVDGIIYCVGMYDPMTAGAWDADVAVRMVDANFTGAMRVLGRVVPDMVARDHGCVALIGSLAGYVGLPGAIGYGASKAALMHLGETMHADLRRTGVRVRVINPGFIKTRLTQKNTFAMPFIVAPEDAARRTLNAIAGRRFSKAFPAPFSWIFRLGAMLPHGVFLRLIKS